jgi:hypothetical protein
LKIGQLLFEVDAKQILSNHPVKEMESEDYRTTLWNASKSDFGQLFFETHGNRILDNWLLKHIEVKFRTVGL